jgi:hypothetical protein
LLAQVRALAGGGTVALLGARAGRPEREPPLAAFTR